MGDVSAAQLAARSDVPHGLVGQLRRHVLTLRFALVNVVAVGIAWATWMQGWLDGALRGDTLWLCAAIGAVFAYGLALCTMRVLDVDRALNELRDDIVAPGSRAAAYLDAIGGRSSEGRTMAANLLRLRLLHPIGAVRHVANALVFLGLVGTVIGFIVALSGVEPDSAVDTEAIAPMVSTLITGMSIALYTTLIGSVLHVWLMVGYRMLATATVELFDAIVDLGEQRVGL